MSGTRPLEGRRILVTRAAEQSVELRADLEGRGAEVTVIPMLAFAPPTSWAAADAAIDDLSRFDAVVFTSANAVKRFWGRAQERVGHCDTPALPAKVIAVGPKTAGAIAERGVGVADLPEEFRGEALAALLGGVRRVLLPRAEVGREEVLDALRATGVEVDVAPVYRTVAPEGAGDALRKALAHAFDAVVLASPSAVTHLVSLLGGPQCARAALGRAAVAAIGPVTAARCAELGIPAAVVPARFTGADLAAALETHFRG